MSHPRKNKIKYKIRHPALIQIRTNKLDLNLLLKWIKKANSNCAIEVHKDKVDVYFSDVNVARMIISKIKKAFKNISVKMSTKYAGIRKGKVRVLFVYSLKDET